MLSAAKSITGKSTNNLKNRNTKNKTVSKIVLFDKFILIYADLEAAK